VCLKDERRQAEEKPNPPAPTNRVREGWISRFLRSQPRRIGLGHPLGRDPERTIDHGHRRNPARSGRYNGRRYWPFACTMEPSWQASLMAS
jgi:hypothetical protein